LLADIAADDDFDDVDQLAMLLPRPETMWSVAVWPGFGRTLIGSIIGELGDVLQERPTTPKPSSRWRAAASGWSTSPAKAGRRTARTRSCGAGPGAHPIAAATRSGPARVTDPSRLAAGSL